jgi:hypothetical protein
MSERLSALFCIGCGRVDVPEPCVGACDERMIDLVLAKEYESARVQAEDITRAVATLQDFISRLVSELPEPDAPQAADWDDKLRGLRGQARSVLHDVKVKESLDEVDRITAWRCVTCGWTEAPRECLGVCVRSRR